MAVRHAKGQDDRSSRVLQTQPTNVFEGIKVKGLPRFTLSRGKVAAEEGSVKAKPGDGEFISRKPYSEVNKALSQWKELTYPRKVERSAKNMPAGV